MEILLYLLLIIIIYFLGHILSLYSSVAYLESDELEETVKNFTGYRKKYLELIIDNPRISIQIASVFKSFSLVTMTLLGVFMAGEVKALTGLSLAVVYSVLLILIWFFYLIFMEYLPRRRVLRTSEKEIVRYILLFTLIYLFFKPVLGLYSRAFSRFGNDEVSEEQKEDIVERAIETLAEQSGVAEPIVEEDEKEMIGQIFQLDQTEVREVMVPRINVKGLEKSSSFEEIRLKTKELGFSRYPVYEDNIDKIIGVLYIKDLFTGTTSGQDSTNIRDFLRRPFFVPESKIISDLLTEFKKTKTHIAIVVDEYGGTAGLVTLEDILEEIVGEIQDEHDSEKPQIVRLPDNSLRVDASVSVEELVEELNLDYETKEFETVGGLIYDLIGSVPSVGAKPRWKDIFFEIENVEGQRIISLKAWVKKGTET
ncbi:MAG TPA: HlyC/CorC family transporter [candidate division Zixibacteria bacterium]|nr:HlyC/CorC family transporter [candidate division Zixibacteria bacterium]